MRASGGYLGFVKSQFRMMCRYGGDESVEGDGGLRCLDGAGRKGEQKVEYEKTGEHGRKVELEKSVVQKR